ncbi:MAG: type II secretion system protein [Planctomycetota bacterium]
MRTTAHSPATRRRPSAAFTMAEMLVVMAIITILAASLAIVIPKLRTRAMVQRAGADIHGIGHALEMYHDDFRAYPAAPFNDADDPHADRVLYKALTDPNYNGHNVGWAGANDEWGFLTDASRDAERVLDPWGLPYFYIAHHDYLYGVRIEDGVEDMAPYADDQPNVFGATPRADDYRSDSNHEEPPDGSSGSLNYYGPPPKMGEFFNPQTVQLHSKGPNQQTDVDDNDDAHIDACDRGTDDDDINNYRQ